MSEILRIYLAICGVIIVFGALLSGYWMFWPYKVIEDPPEFSLVLNPGKTVVAGEFLIFQGDTVHLTNGVQVDVRRELVDGITINYSTTGYVTDGKHFTGRNGTVVIPEYAPPGKYYLKITATFHVNPLRDIIIKRRTEDFMVVAPN